ncbi:MAG: hypothetical protein MZV70_43270 [Desulfobacterales bacterium]|nr:hypothetical protein [Desulfobacterales bacterium]
MRVPAPSPDILDVAAVMKRMSVLVTPDTAMVHIADALGVPVVAMYISHEKLVLWKPCRSVFRGLVSNDGTMDSIRPAEVVNAVSEALEDRF